MHSLAPSHPLAPLPSPPWNPLDSPLRYQQHGPRSNLRPNLPSNQLPSHPQFRPINRPWNLAASPPDSLQLLRHLNLQLLPRAYHQANQVCDHQDSQQFSRVPILPDSHLRPHRYLPLYNPLVLRLASRVFFPHRVPPVNLWPRLHPLRPPSQAPAPQCNPAVFPRDNHRCSHPHSRLPCQLLSKHRSRHGLKRYRACCHQDKSPIHILRL